MTKKSPNYERVFWFTALKYLLHHGLLRWALRRRDKRLVAQLDRSARRVLGRQLELKFSDELLREYRDVTSKTHLWHGTGRLQWGSSGAVDVLQNILQQGGLKPTRDVYMMILTGKEIQSISATPLRIIARSYADTHGSGVNEKDRYGSALWWVSYYYGLGYVELATIHQRKMRKNWAAFNKASTDTKGERTWGKKVHSQAKTVWDTFGLGSDIPGNYPVLFGFRKGARTESLPDSVSKWELRIIEPVEIPKVTHLEVPADKIKETKALLQSHGCSIPVFPIEIGEYVASQQDIGSLLQAS